MTIDNILNKIRADAEAEAQRIIARTQTEVNKIKLRYGRELKNNEEKERVKHEKRIKELRNVRLASAHRDEKQIRLFAEEDIINQCFAEIEKNLNSIKGEKYNSSLKILLEEGLRLIDEGVFVKAVREEDLEVLKNIITELNRSGKQNIVLNKDIEDTNKWGGVYLESKDGKKIVDNTFKTILERNRESYRIEIAKTLFK